MACRGPNRSAQRPHGLAHVTALLLVSQPGPRCSAMARLERPPAVRWSHSLSLSDPVSSKSDMTAYFLVDCSGREGSKEVCEHGLYLSQTVTTSAFGSYSYSSMHPPLPRSRSYMLQTGTPLDLLSPPCTSGFTTGLEVPSTWDVSGKGNDPN